MLLIEGFEQSLLCGVSFNILVPAHGHIHKFAISEIEVLRVGVSDQGVFGDRPRCLFILHARA